MKRLMIFMLAIFMLIGIGTAANAANITNIGLDFYGGDTSYVQGDYDSSVQLNLGDTVMVDFVFDTDATMGGLWKAGFVLSFNDANLVASNYSENNWVGIDELTYGWASYDGNGSGISGGGDSVLFRGQWQDEVSPALGSGGSVIVSFELQCIGIGVDDILFSDWDTDGPDWAWDLFSGGEVIDSEIPFCTIATVENVVPIPGAVWLLGSGLIGLVGLRRRRS